MVDSATALYRTDYNGRGELSERCEGRMKSLFIAFYAMKTTLKKEITISMILYDQTNKLGSVFEAIDAAGRRVWNCCCSHEPGE